MCGINGFNWSDKNLINEMNNRLKHRGPDGEGTYVNKNLSLGHRRLAIIDLTKKGKQPMNYKRGSNEVIITFNGEIYNCLHEGHTYPIKVDVCVLKIIK